MQLMHILRSISNWPNLHLHTTHLCMCFCWVWIVYLLKSTIKSFRHEQCFPSMFPDVEVIIIPFSRAPPYFISSCLRLIYFSCLCFFCRVSYILRYHETNALSWKWRSSVATCVLVLLHYKIRCEDHREEEASFTTKDFRTKIHLSYLVNWLQLLKINPRWSTKAMHSSKEPPESWS